MLKLFGLKTMALAAGLAVAAPTISLARDRDDFRGNREPVRNQRIDHDRFVHRDVDRDRFVRRDRDDYRYNVRVAPTPAATGYYDQFGVWHPYGYYDQFGVWHAY